MHRLPAPLDQRAAELVIRRTERDRIKETSVRTPQTRADVLAANNVGERDGMRRKREDRVGIAGAERTRTHHRRTEVETGGRCAECAVDQERVVAPRHLDRIGELGFQIGAEFRQPIAADGDASRHRVSSAFEQ